MECAHPLSGGHGRVVQKVWPCDDDTVELPTGWIDSLAEHERVRVHARPTPSVTSALLFELIQVGWLTPDVEEELPEPVEFHELMDRTGAVCACTRCRLIQLAHADWLASVS